MTMANAKYHWFQFIYTIPFLEYSYDIKSAIIYVPPKQKNLTLKPVALDEEQLRASEDQLD